jgi:hypothetical protein
MARRGGRLSLPHCVIYLGRMYALLKEQFGNLIIPRYDVWSKLRFLCQCAIVFIDICGNYVL